MHERLSLSSDDGGGDHPGDRGRSAQRADCGGRASRPERNVGWRGRSGDGFNASGRRKSRYWCSLILFFCPALYAWGGVTGRIQNTWLPPRRDFASPNTGIGLSAISSRKSETFVIGGLPSKRGCEIK